MKELTIGLVQQSCHSNRQDNIEKSIQGIREAASRGAQLVVLQELHTSLYFCQTEDTDCFDLAEPIPGPSTDLFGQIAKELNIVIVTSVHWPDVTGKCISPMTLDTMKSSTLPPEISVSLPSQPPLANSAYWFAGINGTPKPQD